MNFEDAWKSVAATQEGIDTSNADIDPKKTRDEGIYLKLIAASRQNPDLRKILIDLTNSIIAYTSECSRLAEYVRDTEISVTDRRESDTNRKRLHDGLITNLNLMSREYGKAGLDNDWRRQIVDGVGSDREQIRKWATNVYELALKNKSVVE